MERFCRCYLQVRSATGKVRRTIINGVWESDFRYVKGIQDAHSEQCGVNNAEGGVEFWFDIGKGSFDSDNKDE